MLTKFEINVIRFIYNFKILFVNNTKNIFTIDVLKKNYAEYVWLMLMIVLNLIEFNIMNLILLKLFLWCKIYSNCIKCYWNYFGGAEIKQICIYGEFIERL